MRDVVVAGGGIAGLAAARRLEALLPDVKVTLVERRGRLGGTIVTERVEGFVIEGGPDSFLSRKERGVGLCEELGLADELVGRRPENARSFVRLGDELHPLPEGLTGLIPTDLDALSRTKLLSDEGRARLAAEVDVSPTPPGEDESVASFVSRRLGSEAYERLVEPLATGIFGGDGELLSAEATFPNLRALELEHGSVLRGLAAQRPPEARYPPFVSLRGGMATLVTRLVEKLERTSVVHGSSVTDVRAAAAGYAVELDGGAGTLTADGLVLALPAYVAAELLLQIDADLADAHADIPYASPAIVTLAYRREDVSHPLDGYGYVVPRAEASDVLACTWTSSKWEQRAPEGFVLLRVYAGRYGVTEAARLPDRRLAELARDEVRLLGLSAEPYLIRIHRWTLGMPQYVLGHPERVRRIERALERHPRLGLAGAAYRGVGVPDCIASGEHAAEAVARVLERVAG